MSSSCVYDEFNRRSSANFCLVRAAYIGGNLRQAVQRTHNAGLSTQIVAEKDLHDPLIAELTELLSDAHRGARTERGFSMSMDGALRRRYPGLTLIIARDRSGRRCRAFTATPVPDGGPTPRSMFRSVGRAPRTEPTSGSAST